jgi:hypothetical protein
MRKVETGSRTIFRFDDVIPIDVCSAISRVILKAKERKHMNVGSLPCSIQ